MGERDRQLEITNRITQIKLKRIEELNGRLKKALLKERIPASIACVQIIDHTQETDDYLVSYLWKIAPEMNKFQRYKEFRDLKLTEAKRVSCCTIM